MQAKAVNEADQLLALLRLVIHSSTVDMAALAVVEGYTQSTLRQRQNSWLLPAYGKAATKRYKRWAMIEYLAWRSIDAQVRKESINAGAAIPKEEVLYLWQNAVKNYSIAQLLEQLRGPDKPDPKLAQVAEHLSAAAQLLAG